MYKEIETIRTKYQASLEELERLYGFLSQRAFKGGVGFEWGCGGIGHLIDSFYKKSAYY